MTSALVEQEFVAHLFAPLDGAQAGTALAEVRAIWQACRSRLGMTQPIVDAGLPGELPADPAIGPGGAVAGLQDPSADFQAVVRREHDVLNLSLAMAAPQGAPRRHRGIAAISPPGWHEFSRLWDELTAAGTGALLGEALVYLAKAEQPAEADVRTAVPPRGDDGERWWSRGTTLDGFAYWEVTPRGFHRARRMVLLGRPGPAEDERISRLAWSAGDAALPPLGRYLMHAAKLRYLGRVHDGGQEPARIRERVAGLLDRFAGLLADPDRGEQATALRGELTVEEAALNATLEALEQMGRSVEIGRDNMTGALDDPVLPDAGIADRLAQRIADDIGYLEATRKRAERIRDLVVPPAIPATRGRPRIEHRIGFGVDVVGYSRRSTPAQAALQRRIAAVLQRVLDDLEVALHDTDRQPAGDGLMVVLPPDIEAPRVLPGLLHGWGAHLAADNGAHPEDHIRLRMSAGTGPFTAAPLGFAGRAIIEVGRLLNSGALRQAMDDRPEADVVVLVSQRLYEDVVLEGYPGLDPDRFERVPVQVKEYRSDAWLWTPPSFSGEVSTAPRGAGPR